MKRRPLVALLAAALAPTALSGFANPVTAQIAIECAAPASPAAAASESSPAVTPTTASTAVTFPPGGGDLTVFAAASLTDAFEEIAAELESANPGLAVTFNFGGSPTLVTQLEQGADADVFASANLAQMDAAEENGSIAGEPVVFVRNRLAIVVPAANPAAIDDAADLADDGVKLILANADVPVGRYARESLCLMGADPRPTARDTSTGSPPTSSRKRRTSATCWPRSSWAKRTPASSTSPTPRLAPTRSSWSRSPTRSTGCRLPDRGRRRRRPGPGRGVHRRRPVGRGARHPGGVRLRAGRLAPTRSPPDAPIGDDPPAVPAGWWNGQRRG
jgi:ABC-type molybdate transport system substrate-binding protein